MSDRPLITDSENTPPGSDSGWNAPRQSSGWHTPIKEESGGWEAPKSKPAAPGWRVPTLPQNLEVAPAQTGNWHLPKSEDTVYTPEDRIIITEPPADEEQAEIVPAEEDDAAAPGEIIPFDESAITPADEAASSEKVDTEPASESETADALELLDEDDEDSFSMSELVALASLVDNPPPAPPAGAALEGQAAPADPADYAREQLERLRARLEQADEMLGQQRQPTEVLSSDQLERLRARLSGADIPQETEGDQVERPSEEQPAAALTQEEQILAQKYQDAEARIRALRDQFRAGQLTREQLQAELRTQMVLDPSHSWWMMGVETDTWYHYEDGRWVAETPPVLEKLKAYIAASAQPSDEPAGTVSEEVAGDQTIRTAAVTPHDYDMPLPRQVPVRDLDYTIPGAEALHIDRADPSAATVPIDLGATMPSAAVTGETVQNAAVSGATVPSPAVQAEQYSYVAAPMPQTADAPPKYDAAAPPSSIYQDAVKRKRQRTMRNAAIVGVVLAGLIFLMGACGVVAGVMYYQSLLSPYQDQIAALANYQPQFQTARIYAADGSVIAELIGRGAGDRRRVALSDISPYMIHAVISTENERYYDDPGWDAIAIARAFLQNLAAGDIESGASTITQQIARNLILQDTTVSAERKLQEIVLAAEIAQRYDKNFILELYLNEFFFGNNSYGIEAAAQFYFGHSATDLNLPEAAMLAGIIQAPAQYDPVVNREAAFDRMDVVMELMAQVGCLQFQHAPYLDGQEFCITQNEIHSGQVVLEKAQIEAREYRARDFSVRYPHFVNYIQAQLEQTFGTDEIFRRGFQIRTTLDPRLQDTAQTALSQTVSSVNNLGVNTGAVFVIDPRDGAIRVMVGSPDFNNTNIDGQVNNVFTWQQPGSSIKPVVYTAALEGIDRDGAHQYLTPASILWDVPTTYATTPPYAPTNYDNTFHGPVTLRYALGNSYNVPAVKTFEFIGADRFTETGQRMGLRFLEEAVFGLPSALGANEVRLYDHAQAYATLANNGVRVPPYAITEITDAQGNPVELPPRAEPAQVVQPQIAYLMQSILSDNEARAAAFGLNSGLALPEYPGLVAAKTGTTNDSTDLWTMGFTRNIVVGVWTGSLSNQRTSATTSNTAIPIWNAVMRAALQGNTPEQFTPPNGIVQQQICGLTGTLYDPNITQNCPDVRMEVFLQNQLPPAASEAFVRTAAIDTWTGQLANQYCPDNTVTGTFANITDQSAIQWLNSAQGAAFAQSLGLETPVQQTPPGQCQAGMQLPQVRLTSPSEGQQVTGVVQFAGQVQAPNFNRYQIEIASISSPDDFVIVSGPTNSQQPNGTLGQWDSSTVPNGVYRVRLAAFANDGGYIFKTMQIGVNNALPTPTEPTFLPTTPAVPTADGGGTPATSVPPEQATPIPFGELSNLGAPTPTLDFGG